MARLFIGLPAEEALQERLQSLSFPESAFLRQTPPEEFHVTLHFLGETSEDQCDRLRTALNDVTCAAFELSLTTAGSFGGRGRPEILWVGLQANPQLLALHAIIAACLRSLELPVETRPYAPHLTVGRMKKASPGVAEEFQRVNATFHTAHQVERFCLYSSNPNSPSDRYTIMESYSLPSSR